MKTKGIVQSVGRRFSGVSSMTDKEIMMALKLCTSKELPLCTSCPYYKQDDCLQVSANDAIDLIKRQQEMIEALIAGQETLQKHFADKMGKIVELLKMCAVNEPLTENGVTVGTVKVMPLPIALEIVKGVQNE